MNNGYQAPQVYTGMYNPYQNNVAQYKPAYQKPLPQSTSPVASFSTGYETYDFQAPPTSFMKQQHQQNIQQQQYQYNNYNNNYNNYNPNGYTYNNHHQQQQIYGQETYHSQKEDDSDSPPPPPNCAPPTLHTTHKSNKHKRRKKKKKHKHKDKPLPINNSNSYNNNNNNNNAYNKPLPGNNINNQFGIKPQVNDYNISTDKHKKRRKHKHKHGRRHHKHKRKDSDSPPPPPPPSDNQYTRRRGISGAQPLIYNKANAIPSHLKLIGGKNGTKITTKNTETINFLKNVLLSQVLFSSMKNKFTELINIMYEIKCPINQCIITQDEFSDTYFIIQYGSFDILLEKSHKNKDKKIKKIGEMLPGKTIGDGSLLYSTPSVATLKATKLSIVWALDAIKFREIRSNISSNKKPIQKTNSKKKIYAKPLPKEKKQKKISNKFIQKYKNLINCKLSDFESIGILGVGSFGRVSLVKSRNTGTTYSLKKIRKNKIIETHQEGHIKNEKQVLASLKSDFCVKLYGVYQDKFNIYFLMEPILGGEVFTILRWNKKFSEKTARFYTACVVLAFEHLHGLGMIYRDLKPENLLISNNGYCKLVDFGFAKKINNTCTLCGTPDYLSPEVIQNDEQTVAVDWWTLGIFLYEMVIGYTPFSDDINGNVKMYEKILTYEVEFDTKETKLSPRVEHLICALLEKNPFHRLGSISGDNNIDNNGTKQILNHPWFHGLDWNKMRKQDITPPYIPEINGTDDLQNFDEYDDENINDKLLKDPNAYNWCKDF